MCECLSLYLFKTAREHKKMAKLVAIAIDATRIEMQYRMPREIRLRSSTRCPSAVGAGGVRTDRRGCSCLLRSAVGAVSLLCSAIFVVYLGFTAPTNRRRANRRRNKQWTKLTSAHIQHQRTRLRKGHAWQGHTLSKGTRGKKKALCPPPPPNTLIVQKYT